MRIPLIVLGVLSLAGCVTNSDRNKFVLSEPNDSVTMDTRTQKHEVRIDENSYLYYNDEEQFYIGEDKLVVVESNESGEPTFSLLDKRGKSFQFDLSF